MRSLESPERGVRPQSWGGRTWPGVFCALLLGALASLGSAQEEPAAKEALQERFRAYLAKQDLLGQVALELRAAQERYMGARQTLHRFRLERTPEELQQAGPQIDALEAELLASRQAYEAKLKGELGSRYRGLKAELDSLLRGLAAGLGARLRGEDDPDLRRMRAALFVDKGRFELALRDLARVLEADPADPVALTLRGRCQEAQGQTEAALADYRRALELAPSDERRARAGVAAFWLNQFSLARELRDALEKPQALPAQLQLDLRWHLASPALESAQARWKREEGLRAADASRGDLPRVELVTSRGSVVLELFEDQAPNTVQNFVELVEKGFYEGLPWHRVQPLRLAASGLPREPGADPAGPGYAIEGEARLEGARDHFRGSVGCLIRGPDRRGGSQFYVLLRPDADLDRQCTVFGRVLSGLEVVSRLEEGDLIKSAKVTRKRDHPYQSHKQPLQ